MNYRKDKYGNKLSILGFGCMRFPSKYGKIDFEETEREILHAFENGVNYYDTAYIYPGSEATLGRILEKNSIRNKVNIATKLPHYLIKSKSDFDRFFSEELERLRTDYIDYYLIHMLTDTSAWDRLKELGIEEWIDEKKRKYHIKNIGFSYHGNSNMFCELIDAYSWDFCMIQYNYMDKNTQAGVAGLQYAHSKNIPVIIIRGRHEIEVSGCCGILEYENETVVLSMGKERFRVRGEALTLSDFREDTLYIRGSISSAEYVEDQNGV